MKMEAQRDSEKNELDEDNSTETDLEFIHIEEQQTKKTEMNILVKKREN